MLNVFVFGSNEQGFHGAGSAGYAMRGDSKNTWRTDKVFLTAMKSPIGSPDRIGMLAIFGIGRGFQQGKHGFSYAICTVKRAGLRRSIPLWDIYEQICELLVFATDHPEYLFQCTPIGCGYSGYTPNEMKNLWKRALAEVPVTDNVILPNYDNPNISDT